ncbi:hypothetical protein IEQ34_026879 [Dendrobium chrysotoxum]|uniref:Uncharacterized protein n=1 Tax=Dendrobium chrysotoxum TaxID=161865 RepID=A0AAV7FIA8_DENCH|nr:hypothetical protein IEQ34_026879 [Dendrobium chrysotoxum]
MTIGSASASSRGFDAIQGKSTAFLRGAFSLVITCLRQPDKTTPLLSGPTVARKAEQSASAHIP